MRIVRELIIAGLITAGLLFVANGIKNALGGTVIKKRTSFSDCKVISEVGYNIVYSCPEGIIYVVKKK